jgi:amino acid transporter
MSSSPGGDATSGSVGASATRGRARDAVDAQHERFGGIKWGAAFFGWLSANGLAVILLALLSAAGVAFGLTQVSSASQAADQATAQADTIGIAGGIALLVVLFLSYLAGGYVAGRMARFDGVRQGVAVWVIGLLVVIVLAVLGAVLGNEYNVLSQLNLPSIPISGDTLTTAGIIAGTAALLVTLLGAVLGGTLGTRYHRKVDRAGFDV